MESQSKIQSSEKVIKSTNYNVENKYSKSYQKEFFVKLKKSIDQQFDILQFMHDSTTNYQLSDKQIFMQQISNNTVMKSNENVGQGTSFSKSKNSISTQTTYKPINVLTIGKSDSQKQFKTTSLQMNNTSQYLIFVRKSQSVFEAYPIENWYKMHKYDKIDIEDIEESKSNKIQTDIEMKSEKFSEKYKPINKNDKEKNSIALDNEIEELSDSEMIDKEMAHKQKKEMVFKKLRNGKNDVHDNESDVDDHQGDEIDYMSDSSCDDDILSDAEKQKIYEICDVGDEPVINKVSEQLDNSDDDEEMKKKCCQNSENIEDNSSDEDCDDESDNIDSDDKKQKKPIGNKQNTIIKNLKRPYPIDELTSENDIKKRKILTKTKNQKSNMKTRKV